MPYVIADDLPEDPAGVRFRRMLERPEIMQLPGAHLGISAVLRKDHRGLSGLAAVNCPPPRTGCCEAGWLDQVSALWQQGRCRYLDEPPGLRVAAARGRVGCGRNQGVAFLPVGPAGDEVTVGRLGGGVGIARPSIGQCSGAVGGDCEESRCGARSCVDGSGATMAPWGGAAWWRAGPVLSPRCS